jgi:RNA polymerase sigma factor (sigma-70 family)
MPPDDYGDAELLAASHGDVEAFATFYRRYAEVVIRYFAVRVRDPELAADLMAETFAAALLGARRYRPKKSGSALAWLFAIAHNKLIDSARRGRAAAVARERLAIQRPALEDEDLRRVRELADLERERPQLLELIEQLPVEQREALLARVIDERSYPEIADELRCSNAVVRKRVSRALATLRDRLIGERT